MHPPPISRSNSVGDLGEITFVGPNFYKTSPQRLAQFKKGKRLSMCWDNVGNFLWRKSCYACSSGLRAVRLGKNMSMEWIAVVQQGTSRGQGRNKSTVFYSGLLWPDEFRSPLRSPPTDPTSGPRRTPNSGRVASRACCIRSGRD